MTYKGFNPVAFARSAATTLAHHVRDIEEAFLRNYQIGALLEQNGRVNYNNTGEGFDWPVQYRIHNVEGNTGETARNFSRRNLWKVANMEFRGYQATDSMFYREFLSNKGPEGIVKVYDQFSERLTQSMKQALGTEYYVDGMVTGNETSWMGLETVFNNKTVRSTGTSQTITAAAGTAGAVARSANAADLCGYPQGTYAGLNMELGTYGGENESLTSTTWKTWPDGLADPEYDFWSPLILNYTTTHADISSATNTWAGQGLEILRYGIIASQRNLSREGQITNILLDRNLYRGALDAMDSKEQIQITSENGLRALGFKNVFVYDGVEVSWEVGVPTNTGYGINYNQMELKSMDATLLRSEGPEYDMDSQAFNAVVSTLSNLKFANIRGMFCTKTLA
jgi:hypothetical protein